MSTGQGGFHESMAREAENISYLYGVLANLMRLGSVSEDSMTHLEIAAGHIFCAAEE